MTNHQQQKTHEQFKKMYNTDKRFFWLLKIWIISRSSFFKTIAILGILLGMGLIIQYNNKCQNELKQYQQLQVFLKIDDLGHEWIANLRKRWDLKDWKEKFDEIDAKFHDTKIVNEKIKLAKEMMSLYEILDANIHKIWGIDTVQDIARDKKYHELVVLFQRAK